MCGDEQHWACARTNGVIPLTLFVGALLRRKTTATTTSPQNFPRTPLLFHHASSHRNNSLISTFHYHILLWEYG
jgi:hypothetical protein